MAPPEDSIGRPVRRMLRLPASLLEGVTRAMCHDVPVNHHGQVPINLQRDGRATVPEEWRFLTSFEEKYGDVHPFFYACRFGQALRLAKEEGKLMFVYVHAPHHPHTRPFCIHTLCSDLVVEFLDANFVSWAAVADGGEGVKIARLLQVNSFPSCAVVAPTEGDNNVAVLRQIEGLVSPSQLVETLVRTIEEQGSAFLSPAIGTGKNQNEGSNHQPKRPPSLGMNKEKEGLRSIPIEDVAMTGRERFHGNPATKYPVGKPTAGLTKIMIRFPNGERRESNFFSTDRIRSVYEYVDSVKVPGMGIYRLVSTFPRKVYGYQQQEMTLKDAGLNHPRVALFLELL